MINDNNNHWINQRITEMYILVFSKFGKTKYTDQELNRIMEIVDESLSIGIVMLANKIERKRVKEGEGVYGYVDN